MACKIFKEQAVMVDPSMARRSFFSVQQTFLGGVKMKRAKLLAAAGSITLIFVLAALMFVAASETAIAGEKPIELRFSVIDPPNKAFAPRGHVPWAKMVEKATNGRVKITIYYSSALAPARQVYDATIHGIADMAWFVTAHYPKRFL